MDFAFTGSCTLRSPGSCQGNSGAACPGGYIGADTEDGAPVQCTASNTGVSTDSWEPTSLVWWMIRVVDTDHFLLSRLLRPRQMMDEVSNFGMDGLFCVCLYDVIRDLISILSDA